MNEPPRDAKFRQLFPAPKNWSSERRKLKYKGIAFLGYSWRDYGEPKYSEIGEDNLVVNDFITLSDKKPFQHDHYHFDSIEHTISYSKYFTFTGKDPREIPMEELTVELSEEQKEFWEDSKYSVCLNASYYMIIKDNDLKEKLLATGDKTLVYESDDEWGGENNLFGFALMELRDELRRLYENEEYIDWQYTEYLKHADPYVTHNDSKNPVDDPQSPEYQVLKSILVDSGRYVRDVNLKEDLAKKYKLGQIITEKAFVDATDKIGGMTTTHRYLILSRNMADLSQFEKKNTNWGLHTANKDSRFKVIDVFEHEGKTQIVLAHLPEGFDSVFKTKSQLENDLKQKLRDEFIETLKLDPIDEVNTQEWLLRCAFPIGMNDEGEFF